MKILAPCLWFDGQAEEAAKYYVSIFKNSSIGTILRYGNAGQEIHRGKPGSVLMVEFKINGQTFTALNGGPNFKFTEAISFQIPCKSQKEVDYYWNRLSRGGDKKAQQCGWLKDKYGVSWQIFPTILPKLLAHKNPRIADAVMKAMIGMGKIDVQKIRQASRL